MKKNAVVLAVLIALFLAALGLGIFLAARGRQAGTNRYAAWRVDEELLLAMEAVLSPDSKESILRLDNNLPLSAQRRTLSSSAILLLPHGYDTRTLLELSSGIKTDAGQLLPSSQRRSGLVDSNQIALPILSNHGELAWNRRLLAARGIEPPASFEALQESLEKARSKGLWPIASAGANDQSLALFLAMLIEARSGYQALSSLAAALQTLSTAALDLEAGDSEVETVDYSALLEAPPLKEAISLLADWRKRSILHPEWLRLSEDDLHTLMQYDVIVFAVMSLQEHRRVPPRTIERFDSGFFPSSLSIGRSRSLLAPNILALPLGRRGSRQEVQEQLKELVQNEKQQKLSAKTGLAPASATAPARDKQASDARLWIAASSRPAPSLDMAFPTDKAFREFARQVRERLASTLE